MIAEILALFPWWALLIVAVLVLLGVLGLASAWKLGTRSLREAVERRRKFRSVDVLAKERVNAEQRRSA